jgi:hypothetical protein
MKMLRAQSNKVTQQPQQHRNLLFVLLLSRANDLLTKTSNPNVAIVQITKGALNAGYSFCLCGHRARPAF